MYVPVVETSASELQATNPQEFLALLRLVQLRSGANRKRISERSGIPSSTTYYLLSEKTTTLPNKLDQVRALAYACGLTKDQVDRVSRLWVELRNPPLMMAPAPPRQPVPNEAMVYEKITFMRTVEFFMGKRVPFLSICRVLFPGISVALAFGALFYLQEMKTSQLPAAILGVVLVLLVSLLMALVRMWRRA